MSDTSEAFGLLVVCFRLKAIKTTDVFLPVFLVTTKLLCTYFSFIKKKQRRM